MRCPKCGYMTFDYVKQCDKCGGDLSAETEMLGLIVADALDFNWFGSEDYASAEPQVLEPEAPLEEDVPPPLDLENIDVSDLISDEIEPESLEEIEELEEFSLSEEDLVETAVVEDKEFQEALEEVIT